MKEATHRIFRETLAGIDIPATMERKLAPSGPLIFTADSAIDLREFDRIAAFAFGKASFAMAEGLSRILAPEFPVDGILVSAHAHACDLAGWEIFTGGHPVPNAASFAAGRAILERLAKCDSRTLIFFLISGGGSSLVEQPLDSSITLEDFIRLNAALVTCGAPIHEMNAVRKHLSATKGGRMAAAAPGSLKITLAISDVPRGLESALASGPTLPDPTTVDDAARVAQDYQLAGKLPVSLRNAIENRRLVETPKPGNAAFARSRFILLLGEHDLTHAAHHACEAEGFVSLIDNSPNDWPVEKAADYLLSVMEEQQSQNPGKPVAVLAGGELSSPVTGDGVGGRNAAFVLACAQKIAGRNITVLSAGTDGIDGNSPAAGAVADGDTMARAESAGLNPRDFMRRSDAYTFFSQLGDTVVTGPTGNNLRDLRILLARP